VPINLQLNRYVVVSESGPRVPHGRCALAVVVSAAWVEICTSLYI